MRRYRGKLQGVVLDWAGTTVDYGCIAPVAVFIEIFRSRGVEITMEEARKPMGAFKRDHIAQVLAMPAVAARWHAVHYYEPTETDVQSLYEAFTPLQVQTVTEHATVIPGVIEAVAAMRAHGLQIGSCTGYTRAMMEPLLPAAQEQGYDPDCVVCPDEVGGGRPLPWMCFVNAHRLSVFPMEAMVKIGDTPLDIKEGLNAGMWTIGLAKTGNEMGLTEAEIDMLTPEDLQHRLAVARQRLTQAGAHYVVDDLTDAVDLIEHINLRLGQGEHPKEN
jgi:phosphonoacetaldehyde hydrolase